MGRRIRIWLGILCGWKRAECNSAIPGMGPFIKGAGHLLRGALIARIREKAPPIRHFIPDLKVNDDFENLLLSMLEKKPDNRPDSAMAVVAAMEKALKIDRRF